MVVGSKLGAEQLILAEMMAQLLESQGIPVERRLGLGSTDICFPALRSGQLDLYPEYSGTGAEQILKERLKTIDRLQNFLYVRRRFHEQYELEWLDPFGFDNTYALAIPEPVAQRLGLKNITDLLAHPELRAGFDLQFMNRPNNWPGLSQFYGLKFNSVVEMEHSLAYSALSQGKVDLVDAWTTDGEVTRYNLRCLDDDRGYFPLYQAAPLVRQDLLKRYPVVAELMSRLAFHITNDKMRELNVRVDQGETAAAVAASFLSGVGMAAHPAEPEPRSGFAGYLVARRAELLKRTREHLLLTLESVALAVCFGVPLGILITRWQAAAGTVLGISGLIQTIPGMALLAFMVPIPGLGLGARSAVLALFLYSLLPIVRNTYTGIREVDPQLIEAAQGLGMRDPEILRLVELPLASRTIMAGVRTCAVINIGSATLAAFIGGGGLGVPIIAGMQLNDTQMVLSGAIPSALLAVLVDFSLGRLERWVGPVTGSRSA